MSRPAKANMRGRPNMADEARVRSKESKKEEGPDRYLFNPEQATQ